MLPEVKNKKDNKADAVVPKGTSNPTTNVVNAHGSKISIPIPIDYNAPSDNYTHKGEKYIPFVGKADSLFNLLFEARQCSVTQDACIKAIVSSSIGEGIRVKNISIDKLDSKFKDFLESCNNDNEGFNDILTDAFDKLKQDGNAFIELVETNVAGVKSLKVYVLNNFYCRFGPEGEDGRPEHIIISKSFAKKSGIISQPGKAKVVKLFRSLSDGDSNWTVDTKDTGVRRTVIHIKNKVSGIDHYGLPDSYSSFKHQVLESKSPQYNLDMFDNNLVLSSTIVFKSAMTQEEAKANGKSIIRSHTGDGHQGRVAIVSSESGIEDFEVIQHNTQKDGSFKDLEETSEGKIITSHNWAKEFIGSPSKGGMNKGGEYLRALWEQKEIQVLTPFRRKLLQQLVSPIMKLYVEITGNKEVENYEFELKGKMPFSLLGDLDPHTYTKRNEAREMAGMDPDTTNAGEEYLGASRKTKNQENVQS
ncbi:MAG TPA: hypothetical protein PLS87_11355 [Ferruginibacter sp.]|nr:hypothetical protein [Ferruginibacter sp.]HRO97464.1 hypothetical protein [Ferruginibacter sp.]